MDMSDDSQGTASVADSPFWSILKWCALGPEPWPEWQRDALRRIMLSGSLGAEEVRELLAICRAQHGLLPPDGIAPAVVPVTREHIPGGALTAESVSLQSLSALKNVGRLPSDQQITFGPSPGLTVIYGENGAGKSGYARVIKKACRARGAAQPIRPDAFAATSPGPAEAKIGLREGSAETVVNWVDGCAPDARLGNILVFDSFSAQVHVGEDGPACFKPRGLEVLPELADACVAIKGELQREEEKVSADITRTAQGWSYTANTAVGRLIKALGPTTSPETIELEAVFTATDDQRLNGLIATLNDDAKKKSADTAAAANRIRLFAESAKIRVMSVDDTVMHRLADAIKEAVTTVAAAKVAAGPELKYGELPWGDNDVWRELWKAAQKYSEQVAYRGRQFPVTEADAKCVLCQQPLQTDAMDRYFRFNAFVADATRRQADAAEAKVTALKGGVDSLRPIRTEASGIQADLDREAAGTFSLVEDFATAVDSRIGHAQKCLKDLTWTDAPQLPASPYAELVALADTLERRAKEELSAADPEKAKALAAERAELVDRKWLAGKKDEVKAQIGRHEHVARLKKCQEDCQTNTITRKSGELHETHVTTAFRGAFKDELKALGLKSLPVKLDGTKGTKGERRFGVKLEGSGEKVQDIASEGEHRCVALAAFMAELSLASSKSAVVFDDPVSSLDHKRRDAIATRLVKEAKCRQVVVFTHDLAFVCDLESAASGSAAAKHFLHVECSAGRPGRVASDLVWDAKSPKEQLKQLSDQIKRADKVYQEENESRYREEVNVLVDEMRSACERIIEDVLLCDVLKRHSSQIKVGNVYRIAAIDRSHWLEVKRVWSECSAATPAHANAKSGPHRVPEPDKLRSWLQALDTIVNPVKKAST